MSRARKKKADMNSLGVVLSPRGLAGAERNEGEPKYGLANRSCVDEAGIVAEAGERRHPSCDTDDVVQR